MFVRQKIGGFVAVLIVAALLPIGTAAPGDGQQIATDPAGDTSVELLHQGSVPVMQSVTWTDLSELQIEEDAQGFWFHVLFHHEQADNERGTPTSLDVYFAFGAEHYWLDLYSREFEETGAALWSIDEVSKNARAITPAARLIDEQLRSYSAYIPRQFLTDENGATPFPGQTLTKFAVESYTIQARGSDEFTINDFDRMPDEGVSPRAYEVLHGLLPTGDARLFSPNPSRGSNGASSTYVYSVIAGSEAIEQRTYRLAVQAAPDGWSVTLPSNVMNLAPQEYREVPVVVAVPFQHRHGDQEVIDLQLVDAEDDAHHAELQLSIVYHEIPQPAGHHNTLYFHSQGYNDNALSPARPTDAPTIFMNTLDGDETDTQQQVPAVNPSIASETFRWEILLDPSLRLGLDFDLEDVGTLTASIATQSPTVGASISGELYVRTGNRTVLASISSQDLADQPMGGTWNVELPLMPHLDGDFFRYEGPTSMVLGLYFHPGRTATDTTPETPVMLPGGQLVLPLNEYREPLADGQFKDQQNALVPIGRVQRAANPGDEILFRAQFTEPAQNYDLRLLGAGSEQCQIVIRDGVVNVILTIPADILADNIDLILQATPLVESSPYGLLRFLSIIDDAENYPSDDEAIARILGHESSKSSPGAPTFLVLLLVVGLARRRP